MTTLHSPWNHKIASTRRHYSIRSNCWHRYGRKHCLQFKNKAKKRERERERIRKKLSKSSYQCQFHQCWKEHIITIRRRKNEWTKKKIKEEIENVQEEKKRKKMKIIKKRDFLGSRTEKNYYIFFFSSSLRFTTMESIGNDRMLRSVSRCILPFANVICHISILPSLVMWRAHSTQMKWRRKKKREIILFKSIFFFSFFPFISKHQRSSWKLLSSIWRR